MKRYISTSLILSVFALGVLMSTNAQAQNLIRLSAQFRNFFPGAAFPESFTTDTVAAGGSLIYTQVITAPVGMNTLYVTISGTGDTHDGARSLFGCFVDGVPCNPGGGPVGAAPPGWVTLQKMPAPTTITNCSDGGGGPADCHDNGIVYQWCATLPPAAVATGGLHTINVKMASGTLGAVVFIEEAHFYIDGTKGPASCNQGLGDSNDDGVLD